MGSGEGVADELRAWMEETGIDGFNSAYAPTPGTFEDMADLVVPELQARGLFKHEYALGTFRDNLFVREARLPASHPADAVRLVVTPNRRG
jgi:hypothetical protein